MRFFVPANLILFLLVSGSANLLAEEVAEVEIPADTQVLFSKAQDFEHWKGNRERWSVEDNTIVGRNTAENPLPEHTYLIFNPGEFSDFELTLQFKIEGEGGNSGVQYRSKVVNEEKFKVAGYQADIDFNNKFAGIVYEQDGRGIVALRGESVTLDADGEKIRKKFGDATKLGNGIHAGQWNEYRIVANGNRLEHYINNALTAQVTDDQTDKAATSGIIALQLHKGPPMTVRFKNIVVRKLASGD
jgi:Domain of Unknown Function (DUF1080)